MKRIRLLAALAVGLFGVIEFAEERWEIRVSRACEAYLGGALLVSCRAIVGPPSFPPPAPRVPGEALPERPAPLSRPAPRSARFTEPSSPPAPPARASERGAREPRGTPLTGLLNSTAGGGRGTAVEIVVTGRNAPSQTAVSSLETGLRDAAPGSQLSNAVFSARFRSEGYFDRVFAGQASLLEEIGVFIQVDRVLLGRLSATCDKSSARDDMAICDVSLDYRIFTRNGIAGSGRVTQRGGGFSRDDAIVRGAELIAERDASSLLVRNEGG